VDDRCGILKKKNENPAKMTKNNAPLSPSHWGFFGTVVCVFMCSSHLRLAFGYVLSLRQIKAMDQATSVLGKRSEPCIDSEIDLHASAQSLSTVLSTEYWKAVAQVHVSGLARPWQISSPNSDSVFVDRMKTEGYVQLGSQLATDQCAILRDRVLRLHSLGWDPIWLAMFDEVRADS
jgi:hypothetical protein